MGKLILFIIGDLIMGAEYCNIMINDPELKMTDKVKTHKVQRKCKFQICLTQTSLLFKDI